jgi:protein TonB
MPTETLPTRADAPTKEAVSTSFVVALCLHAAIAGAFVGWAFITHASRQSWGDHSPQTGSIAVTAVSSLPLPPRVPVNTKEVLASENPSIAPKPPTPKTEPPPKPKEILIPDKVKPKPSKTANKPAPEPPKHPTVTPPDPKKATVGETAGVRIPMSVQQVKNGTASITVDDRSFGERYSYYARIVDRKVSESWNSQQVFPGAASGMRAVVVFTINADGTPSDPKILQKSGSAAFDALALRTIQRIDGFGPLPQSKPITVEFALDYKQP